MEPNFTQYVEQSTAKKRQAEMLVFRLRRNRTDEEQNIIRKYVAKAVLEDRPNKRMKLTSSFGLEYQLNKLNLSEYTKQNPIDTCKLPEQGFFNAPPDQKYLKRVKLNTLTEESDASLFAEKISVYHHRNIRQELIKALRGEAFDKSTIKIHDIDSSRFMIVNGQKVPFKNIGNEGYEEDFYICRRDPLKIEEYYPVLECPRELEDEFDIDDHDEEKRSSADSQDSNDQDNSDNDYPDYYDSGQAERDSFDEYDIYRNDNDSLVDEEEECDNQEDFCDRIRRKREERRIRREDHEEDDDDYLNY